MYLAMNRFQVKKERAADFEAMWIGRDSNLPEIDGFVEFRLLKGPTHDDHVLYSSHTFWDNEDTFVAWTKSEAFRKAHARPKSGQAEPMTLGHPCFEGFTTLQTISKSGERAA